MSGFIKSALLVAIVIFTSFCHQKGSNPENPGEEPVPQDCGSLSHESSIEEIYFTSSSVSFGDSCDSQQVTRLATCNDGTISYDKELSLKDLFTSCIVEDPKPCGDLSHGDSASRIRYKVEQVPFGESCEAQKEEQSAVCSNGELNFSSSAEFENCSIEEQKV